MKQHYGVLYHFKIGFLKANPNVYNMSRVQVTNTSTNISTSTNTSYK